MKKGQKPTIFTTDKAITQKDWQRSLHQEREPSNPVRTGFRFVEYLNDNPNATYDARFSRKVSCPSVAPPGESTKERCGSSVEADVFGIPHDLSQTAPVESGVVFGKAVEDEAQDKLSKGSRAQPGQFHRGPVINASWMGKLFPPIGGERGV